MNLGAIFGICMSLLLGSFFLSPYSSAGKEVSTQRPSSSKSSSRISQSETHNAPSSISLEPISEEEKTIK